MCYGAQGRHPGPFIERGLLVRGKDPDQAPAFLGNSQATKLAVHGRFYILQTSCVLQSS